MSRASGEAVQSIQTLSISGETRAISNSDRRIWTPFKRPYRNQPLAKVSDRLIRPAFQLSMNVWQ